MSDRCGISQSKISKIETGKVLASVTDVERILTALGAKQDLAEELLSLARLANTEFQSVRASLRRGLHQKQRELAALEADAIHIRFFLPLMITGLLQTPEYARASLANFPGDHAQAIAKRLERQATLYNRAKRLTFLLTEAAVRWQLVEPAVMAVQMGRLASLSELPNIRLGIIPLDTYIPDGPLNTFTVYDDRLATAETFGGAIMMRDPRDVAYHLELFAFFSSGMPSLTMRFVHCWKNMRTTSAEFLRDRSYSNSGIIPSREFRQNACPQRLWSCCGNWQNPRYCAPPDPPGSASACQQHGADAGGDIMSGHTDAVYQTTMHQASPGRSSDVGVVSPVSEPGFLALAPAMYRRTYLELGALLTAPSCARLHTKQLLWEWGLDKLTEISEAIVSELVTNAYETTIRHSLDAPIRLRLSSNGQVALIEVWDADPTAPRVPALDANHLPLADAESGRGLFLVASLSERWSCYTTTGHAGKVVWAECALEAPDCIPGSAGRNLEDIPGSMAYLASKGKGDRSMPLKRWSGPGIRDGVPQDPRNMSES